jgi:hypothetical protein
VSANEVRTGVELEARRLAEGVEALDGMRRGGSDERGRHENRGDRPADGRTQASVAWRQRRGRPVDDAAGDADERDQHRCTSALARDGGRRERPVCELVPREENRECAHGAGAGDGKGDGDDVDIRDPVLERLFPRAYLDPTEEQAEAEWQRFSHDDLVDGRRQAVATVERTLAGAQVRRGRFELTLSEDEAQAWLSVINDARLALGTRLDVTEDMDMSRLNADDPDTAPYAVYWWLGVLEERLIDVLS